MSVRYFDPMFTVGASNAGCGDVVNCEDRIKFIEGAYSDLQSDLRKGYLQAEDHIYCAAGNVRVAIEDIEKNIIEWYQFYEGLLYGESK